MGDFRVSSQDLLCYWWPTGMAAAKNFLLTVCWERMLVIASLQKVTNPSIDEFTAKPSHSSREIRSLSFAKLWRRTRLTSHTCSPQDQKELLWAMVAARVTPRIALPTWDHCECTIFCLADMQEAKRQANSQVGQSLDDKLATHLQDLHPLSIAKDLNLTWTSPGHGVGRGAQLSLFQHWNSRTTSVWLVMCVAQ